MKNIPAKEYFNVTEFNHFSIPVTDACNLQCDCCSTRGNLPYDKDGEILCRQEMYKIDLDALELFLSKLDAEHVGYSEYHRLTGGEPTLFVDLCRETIETIAAHGREMCLLTNGCNLTKIEPELLKKIAWINLDDHNVNHDTIVACKKYLKPFYKGKLTTIKYKFHYDLEYAMYHPKNDCYCGHMCRVIMMFDRVVFPCAHHYCVELYLNTIEYRKLLVEKGFSVDGDFMPLLQNWRETIPEKVWEICNDCWRPYYKFKKLPIMKK